MVDQSLEYSMGDNPLHAPVTGIQKHRFLQKLLMHRIMRSKARFIRVFADCMFQKMCEDDEVYLSHTHSSTHIHYSRRRLLSPREPSTSLSLPPFSPSLLSLSLPSLSLPSLSLSLSFSVSLSR